MTVTPRQLKILQILSQQIAFYGKAPSQRELSRVLGIRSHNSLVGSLRTLEKKGLLQRGAPDDNCRRSVELTDAGKEIVLSSECGSSPSALEGT